MIVGLTGGIGSGKSTVAQMFKDLGIPVYDSDREAKLLMNGAPEIRQAIILNFGEAAYTASGLNRAYISNLVFKDIKLLQKLNQIVHPAVAKHFSKWVQKQSTAYIIQESALIFENQSEEKYDQIILVTAPLEERIKRVMKRDKVDRGKVEARINNQLPDTEKEKKANFTIINTNLGKTAETVAKIHEILLNKSVKQ